MEVNRHRLMFLDIRKDPRGMCCRSSSIGPDQWNHGKVTVTGQVVLPNYDSFLGWCSFFKKKTTCAHVYKFFLLVDISDHFSTSSSTKLLHKFPRDPHLQHLPTTCGAGRSPVSNDIRNALNCDWLALHDLHVVLFSTGLIRPWILGESKALAATW